MEKKAPDWNPLGNRKRGCPVQEICTEQNSSFYSCVLVTLPLTGSEAGGDLALIQTFLPFIC